MKACPNAAILRLFHAWGVYFDCSSGYEVGRALLAGIPAANLSLSSQELPTMTRESSSAMDFEEIIRSGVRFNACSVHQVIIVSTIERLSFHSYLQLTEFGKRFPGGSCGIRFNPGTGSGGTGKTVTACCMV
jgi:diaminopimelate decarboxylase